MPSLVLDRPTFPPAISSDPHRLNTKSPLALHLGCVFFHRFFGDLLARKNGENFLDDFFPGQNGGNVNDPTDIQSYLLRFGVLGCLIGMFLGSSHTFLGGGSGCR